MNIGTKFLTPSSALTSPSLKGSMLYMMHRQPTIYVCVCSSKFSDCAETLYRNVFWASKTESEVRFIKFSTGAAQRPTRRGGKVTL